MAEHDIQKKKEDLENIKEVVAEFERKMNTEVRRQEKLDMIKKRDFRREELLEKFTTKMLYRQDDRKFEEKHLRKLKRNW